MGDCVGEYVVAGLILKRPSGFSPGGRFVYPHAPNAPEVGAPNPLAIIWLNSAPDPDTSPSWGARTPESRRS